MKDLSARQWFWTLLVVIPVTFYVVELFAGAAQPSVFSMMSYLISAVLGLLLAYGLFSKALVKISHVNGFNLLAFVIIMVLVVLLALLVSFLGINQLGILIFKTVILTFNISALVLAFGSKRSEIDDRTGTQR
ncbi:hypothetical protein [Arsukibacterium indicum]|uniref:Uncharacterized protein n=1 Tax=Arsukibacterium indicum TaxID=2848612 RepID=A0ABS6MJ30_9GAMM|nr:hypothetical protein [Arsukibacterium indicum]MBV2128825.1 hypothetical protein [Arsukibacterium indicum]